MDAQDAGRERASNEVVDPFATDAPIVSEAEKRGWTREQAIAHGRKLAEDENKKLAARRAGFTEHDRKTRVEVAEKYAAWEYDGRAVGTIGRRV